MEQQHLDDRTSVYNMVYWDLVLKIKKGSFQSTTANLQWIWSSRALKMYSKINVAFMPTNITSTLQPMDQGINFQVLLFKKYS